MATLHRTNTTSIHLAMGEKPGYPPANIPIATKIGSKMGVEHLPQNGTIGFDPQPSEA